LKQLALLAAAPQAEARFCAWYVSQASPHDVNTLVDKGCPTSAGGINIASDLARQLGIDFTLMPLDSTPFLHGFGESCSDAKLTVARWMLPVENLDGEDVKLEFFLVPGSGPLLLGNFLLHKAVVDGPDDLIEFTDAKSLRVVTPTCFDGVRTRLAVVTTRGDLLQQQQATRRSYLMSSTSRPSSNAESGKLAFKLQTSSHLSARDLEEMCRRWDLVAATSALSNARDTVVSCMFTHGKTSSARKFHSRTSTGNLTTPCRSIFSIWTVSTGVPSYMLWIPAQVFLWLDYA
jgi:hypothetical protein